MGVGKGPGNSQTQEMCRRAALNNACVCVYPGDHPDKGSVLISRRH